MLRKILERDSETLLSDLRVTLGDLRASLAAAGAPTPSQEALADSLRQLDELFLLVVVGEFNAGKSVLLNALIGQDLLEQGVTPTTGQVHLLRYGDAVDRRVAEDGYTIIEAPIELLRQIHLVDTPGTNAIDREHEALTRRFVPRADLVLFVTSADRPFTESERAFMQGLREWGKKVVVLVNKIDILERQDEIDQVVRFVRESANSLLGFDPTVFALSGRRALRAIEAGEEDAAFEELLAFVNETLDERERLRLKLENPLHVGLKLVAEQSTVGDQRLELLAGDFETLDDLERQVALYREDMDREFRHRLNEVEALIGEIENRGIAFFDDRLRILRVPDLLNKSKNQLAFEREVIGDLPDRIEKMVNDLIDWMVDSELRQWQAVTAHVRRREGEHEGRIVGSVEESAFETSRARLLDSLGRSASRAVETYDQRHESERLAASVQQAVAGTALLQVGAVGLGGLVAALASTTAADITGFLAAGTLATLGLFVIPNKRRQAKAELRERLGQLRSQLTASLRSQFESEISRSQRSIEEAVQPYTRFVRSEREKLEGERETFRALRHRLEELAGRIEQI